MPRTQPRRCRQPQPPCASWGCHSQHTDLTPARQPAAARGNLSGAIRGSHGWRPAQAGRPRHGVNRRPHSYPPSSLDLCGPTTATRHASDTRVLRPADLRPQETQQLLLPAARLQGGHHHIVEMWTAGRQGGRGLAPANRRSRACSGRIRKVGNPARANGVVPGPSLSTLLVAGLRETGRKGATGFLTQITERKRNHSLLEEVVNGQRLLWQ